MLTKLTLLTAVAQAVTVGVTLTGSAAAPTGYIKWATTAAATDPLTWGANGYGCLRKLQMYAYPMATTANNAVTVPNTTQQAVILTFWPTTTAQLGTTNAVGTATAVGQNSGCTAITLGSATPPNIVAAAASTITPDRLVWQPAAADPTYAQDTPASPAIGQFMNIDFVLATTFQNSWGGVAATARVAGNYCDKQIYELTTAAPTGTATTMPGLKGDTKCTYFVQAGANAGAPAFKITTLEYIKFQLHYAEWSGVDAATKYLNTNIWTGTAPKTDFFVTPIRGTYPANAGSASVTGLSAWGAADWPSSGEQHANWWAQGLAAGNVGSFNAYASFEGSPFTDTQTAYDSGALLRSMDMTATAYATYNTAKSTYDTSRTTYNTALSNEKTRAGDFFKSIFEAPVKIPARPCPPSQPAAWTGPQVDWWVTNNAIGSINATTKPLQYGVFTLFTGTTTKPSLQAGYLAATPDNSIAAPVAAPGHTFGVRGQGNATNGVAGTGWAGRVVSASATHTIMVSLFPYDGTDTTGIAANKSVVLSFSCVTWRAAAVWGAPVQPAAAVAPDAAAAAYLAAGAAAIAAVAATMF